MHETVSLRIVLTTEAVRLLDEMAEAGIYGATRAEVAARFVDQMLMNYVEEPTLQLRMPSQAQTKAGFLAANESKGES